MSLRGHCPCRNFELVWQTVDLSLVPRSCQCAYCRAKGAAYVSKSGSAVTVKVHQPELHNVVRHGSGTAMFHECGGCDAVVLVTAEIQGLTYGAINAACINNPRGFGTPVAMDFSGQSAQDKLGRWQQNWCCPVTITVAR